MAVKEEQEDVDDSSPAPAAAVYREVGVERPSAAYKRAAERESAATAVHREAKVEVAERESEWKKLKSRLANEEKEQTREQGRKRKADNADFSDNDEDNGELGLGHGLQHWTKEQWQAWDVDPEPAEEEDKHGMRHWTNHQWQAWDASPSESTARPADPNDEKTAPWARPRLHFNPIRDPRVKKRGRLIGNQRKDAKGIPKEVQLGMKRLKKELHCCESFPKEVQLAALQEEIRETQLALGLSGCVSPWLHTSCPEWTTYPPYDGRTQLPPLKEAKAATAPASSTCGSDYPVSVSGLRVSLTVIHGFIEPRTEGERQRKQETVIKLNRATTIEEVLALENQIMHFYEEEETNVRYLPKAPAHPPTPAERKAGRTTTATAE